MVVNYYYWRLHTDILILELLWEWVLSTKVFLCFMFLKNKRSEGGAVSVVLIQFNKRFQPVAENVNKQRHLRSPLEASSQLQKNVIVVVGCFQHYTLCPVDTATAGSWAGVGLVN
jgi:hypothetical protein